MRKIDQAGIDQMLRFYTYWKNGKWLPLTVDIPISFAYYVLSEISFRNANLSGLCFRGANCSNTDFTNAELTHTNFDYANLSGVATLSNIMLYIIGNSVYPAKKGNI